jgi:hypothetical protein
MTGGGMVQQAQFDPLSAGAFLLTILGIGVGAIVGLPASVAGVILRYGKRPS